MSVIRNLDIEEVKRFILIQSPETKIYLGCDSERIMIKNQWYADYTTAIVVHIDSKHGCKLFGQVEREKDFDQKRDRPRLRLMNEVYRVSEMYLRLSDVIVDRNVEVHLDINPNDRHGSSCVINEAVGYIRGTCNVIPLVKPFSWAATHAADRFKEVA